MGARISSGFTIIETMLFLAVTGLLIMGALIGAGTSIANQRYKDSVETFKTLLQTQYSELGSIKNDRPDTLSCGTNAIPVTGSQFRGQSDCMIVGRYMTINAGDIAIYTVLAHANAGATAQPNDVASLNANYTYNVTPDVEDHTMEWGTQIAWPSSGGGARTPTTPRTLGILIVRSPDSGRVYTFTSDSIPSSASTITNATFKSMIIAGNVQPGQAGRTVCVQSNGSILGGDEAVYLQTEAASASAVEVRSNSITLTIDGPGGSQC